MESKVDYAFIKLMDERGLSQAAISRATGIPPSTLNRYMQGADMPASNAKAIADAIGVSVDEFLGIKKDEMLPDEHELLEYYRASSVRGKANLLEYAEDTARRHPMPKSRDDND